MIGFFDNERVLHNVAFLGRRGGPLRCILNTLAQRERPRLVVCECRQFALPYLVDRGALSGRTVQASWSDKTLKGGSK